MGSSASTPEIYGKIHSNTKIVSPSSTAVWNKGRKPKNILQLQQFQNALSNKICIISVQFTKVIQFVHNQHCCQMSFRLNSCFTLMSSLFSILSALLHFCWTSSVKRYSHFVAYVPHCIHSTISFSQENCISCCNK